MITKYQIKFFDNLNKNYFRSAIRSLSTQNETNISFRCSLQAKLNCQAKVLILCKLH